MLELVERRTRNSKTYSLGGRKYAWDGTIGSIHYEDNGWQEIDNEFLPVSPPWDWEMLRAGYHIRVKEDFTVGQIIEFEKQGETVQFQPMALEWTNDLDQIQSISMPQNVTPIVTNPEVDLLPAVGVPSHQGTIRWDDAYGEGIDFEWKATSTRLAKILEIEGFDKLPIPEQYILDGGNPVLRLNLIFDPSRGVDVYVDGEVWDKKAKKQTFNVIEFRKDGEVLWGFMPLRYWGSGTDPETNEGQSIGTLEKRGNKLYISIRVPYDWLQSATYPVFIDTNVDETMDAGNEDAHEKQDNTGYDANATTIRLDASTVFGRSYDGGFYWDTVDVPKGSDNIIDAYISIYPYSASYDDVNLDVYGNDVDSANNFDIEADVASRGKTSESVPWVQIGAGLVYANSPDISVVVQEIVNRNNWTANNNMCLILSARSDFNRISRFRSYNGYPSQAAKLHIEYTVAGPEWKQLQYTSEPPTPNAWNQLKHTIVGGWNQIRYEGE